ncbi:MAG: hypothetical protein IPL23_06300 [Saprospiraceae bacterium]|nr:hypothetical protein [Saprospiraceae bacterium]
MRHQLLTIAFLFCFIWASGQTDLEVLIQNNLDDQKTAMMVLGSWGIGNVVAGSIGALSTDDKTWKSFHQMNIGWGVVNTALAAFGVHKAGMPIDGISANELLRDNMRLTNVLLFNAGLDVAYIASGFYLKEKGKTAIKNKEKWKGYGKSLILQGAFLLIFDSYAGYHFSKQSQPIIEWISTGNSIGLSYKF